jgi:hypothetical protein
MMECPTMDNTYYAPRSTGTYGVKRKYASVHIHFRLIKIRARRSRSTQRSERKGVARNDRKGS